MTPVQKRKYLWYAIDLLIVAISVIGIVDTAHHAGIPGQFENQNDAQIGRDAGPYRAGDRIVSLNGMPIDGSEPLFFELEGHQIGERVQTIVQRGDQRLTIESQLVPYYSSAFIVLVCLAALVFFVLALFVMTERPDDPAALICHWIGISVAITIANSDAHYTFFSFDYTTLPQLIHRIADSLRGPLFFHFAFRFPRRKHLHQKWLIPSLYLAGVVIAVLNDFAFAQHQLFGGLPNAYLNSVTLGSVFETTTTIAAIGVFIHSFYTTHERQQRQKLKWIFSGIFASMLTHVLLWQIPLIAGSAPLIDEWIVILLSTIAPISFVIAVIRYQLFDIDFIINRSAVYTSVLGMLILLYESIVQIIESMVSARLVQDDYAIIPSVAGAIVGLTFEPLRKRIEHIANRTLFRKHHSERSSIAKLIADLRETLELRDLADLCTQAMEPLVGATHVDFYEIKDGEVRLLSSSAGENPNHAIEHRDQLQKFGDVKHILGARHLVESDVSIDFSWDEVLHAHSIAILAPLMGSDRETIGFLCVGRKELTRRYSTHDLMLLSTVATSAAGYMERVLRWEQRLRERLHAQAIGAEPPTMAVSMSMESKGGT